MDITLAQIIQALVKASEEVQRLTQANEKLKAELEALKIVK